MAAKLKAVNAVAKTGASDSLVPTLPNTLTIYVSDRIVDGNTLQVLEYLRL